jgi:ribonuclease R
MKKVWFGNTVIHSRRRFTYEEAFETLSTGTDDWASILKTLNSIAKELREKRIANGAISLESDEIKFVLNEHGFPIAVKKKVRNDAHKLIEEFMLLANTLVAEELSDETKKDEEEPMLFRVHERPTLEKMNDLSLYLRGLGHSVEMKNGIIPTTTLIRVVKETDDKDLREIMQGVIIRSMQKAVYTTKNKGHFGLALSHYTHFTSPIRRYPDTVIHRLLKEYVAHGDIKKKDIEAYNDIAEHASMRESDAQEAERASDKYFQTLFMMDKIGTETRGTVTGMSDRGIFVRDDTSFAEGFVRFRGNFEESFVVDKKRMQVRGEKTGIVFSLGDKLTLRVDGANPERREIDYSVIL